MVALKDRLRAFEMKHRYDEETLYHINARAAHKLGAWCARHMRYTDEQVNHFIHNEIFEHLARKGMPYVMEYIRVKMEENKTPLSDYILTRQKDRFVKEARLEVMQLRKNPMAKNAR